MERGTERERERHRVRPHHTLPSTRHHHHHHGSLTETGAVQSIQLPQRLVQSALDPTHKLIT